MFLSKYLKGMLALAAIIPSFAYAEMPVNSLIASLEAGDEGFEPNGIAEADGVELLVPKNSWDGGAIALESTDELTITANEFKNICAVTITSENEWDYYLLPNKVGMSIVSAKDADGEPIQNLGCPLSSKFTQDHSCRFDFGPGVRLSEVTLRPSLYVGIIKVSATLDVAPKVSSDAVTVYADEPVPFQKQSNYITYRYYVSPDAENIIEDPEELAHEFEPIPEEGITLSGNEKGDYMVYIDSPANMESAIQHLKVHYDPNPATQLSEIQTSTPAEYFDLTGRRLSSPARGLQIVRQGPGSRLILK